MDYISTPLTFDGPADGAPRIEREQDDVVAMMDNLVELVVFTPRGSFDADPDFGFEYWNHEFSNVHYREFNNGQTGRAANGLYNEVTKKECQDSIVQSLATYAPQLKQVSVGIEIDAADATMQRKGKAMSKYVVTVTIEGVIDNGLGTTSRYSKGVSFMMEPTAKKYRI